MSRHLTTILSFARGLEVRPGELVDDLAADPDTEALGASRRAAAQNESTVSGSSPGDRRDR